MNKLETLEGKTIKTINIPDEITINGSISYDENIEIIFTDGTILKLASWDEESYCSGIYKEIIN